MSVVLDASAVLAFLLDEPGADRVGPLLEGGIVASPNWSELLQKVTHNGGDATQVARELIAVGIEVQPVGREIAETAAAMWAANQTLSLGDRFCLATAISLEVDAVTADEAWASADAQANVILIR